MSRTRLSDFTFTFHFHAMEKEMATHSSVLAWRIPGTGEPGGLPSMGLHRVGHNWCDLAAAAGVFIPEKSAVAKRQDYFQRALSRNITVYFEPPSLLFDLKFEKRNWLLYSTLKRPSPEIFLSNKYQMKHYLLDFSDWTVKVFTSFEEKSKIP